MKATHYDRLIQNMPVNGLEHIGARRVRPEIQLEIQSEQFKRIVMMRSHRGRSFHRL